MALRFPIGPTAAAELVRRDYDPHETLDAEARFDNAGVQASVVRHAGLRIGLIRGSDQLGDWVRNVRFAPRAGTLLSAAVALPAAGTRYWWHRGFLEHARLAWQFLMSQAKPDLIVGHSLGAACMQVICSSEDFRTVPGLGFASPRPAWLRDPRNAELVENICRCDDPVCRLPPRWLGYRHVGHVTWVRPEVREWGERHRIGHYATLLAVLEKTAQAGAAAAAT